MFGMTMAFASCANDDLAQNGTMPTDDKGLTTFSTGDPATRTTMKDDGTFYWDADDHIYVKDDDGHWNKSSNAPTSKTAAFKFKVPGKYIAHNSYEVYYPGKNGTNDQVTIPATQTQTTPNTTDHFGESGDCGMASASRIGTNNQFNFTLDHKAAYLRFLPRTGNTILHDCYLTKIEVTSDNDITATYTLDPVTGKLTTGTGTGKQIVLTTQSSGTYTNGFPLTNNTTSAATNGAYMIIKPGTHTLKVRYWVKDIVTGVEGTITKVLISKKFEQNKYYDITANLNVRAYDGDHYSMWDAQEQYWKGHEWLSANKDQPVLYGHSNSNYPKSNSDLRYYNEYFPGTGVSNPATHTLCKDLPNANEMAWYVKKGDPRWDPDEVWTTLGHLYKTGIWIKKKSKISGFTDAHIPDNPSVDLRTQHQMISNNNFTPGLPSASEIGDYFYLPALGFYDDGKLGGIGFISTYWSSSADPQFSDSAYYLYYLIYANLIEVDSMERRQGNRAQKFSYFGDN